ncbi:MAG: ABC transporter substrate-binding protein [Candidatus Rokubacteria bacterium]|nr:ABC transporter substrate-binding protein [Candidatus Rokubacteria bacterium]
MKRFAIGLVLVLGLPGARHAPVADEATRVVVQLKWHHQTQFAGHYVADRLGLYAREGLAVEHRPWTTGDPSPVERVVSGGATVGITSQTQFLIDRQRGAPVVAVAAVYQKSPVAFFALKGSGIRRPQDFAGKTIAFAPTHELHLRAMLKRLGIDFASLRRVPYGFDLRPFYRGEVAIMAGYVMNQPVDARLDGHEVTVVLPSDYRVRTYDDIVFTSEETLRRDPALVERWLRATLQGWRRAIEQPEQAVAATLSVDPSRRRDKELAMLLESIPLIRTGEHPIGWMTRAVWDEAARMLVEERLLPQPPDLDQAYTTRILERVYAR